MTVVTTLRPGLALRGSATPPVAPGPAVLTLSGLLGRPSVTPGAAPRSRVGRAPTERTGVPANALLRREGHPDARGQAAGPRHHRAGSSAPAACPPSMPWLRMATASGAVLTVGTLGLVSVAGGTSATGPVVAAVRDVGNAIAGSTTHTTASVPIALGGLPRDSAGSAGHANGAGNAGAGAVSGSGGATDVDGARKSAEQGLVAPISPPARQHGGDPDPSANRGTTEHPASTSPDAQHADAAPARPAPEARANVQPAAPANPTPANPGSSPGAAATQEAPSAEGTPAATAKTSPSSPARGTASGKSGTKNTSKTKKSSKAKSTSGKNSASKPSRTGSSKRGSGSNSSDSNSSDSNSSGSGSSGSDSGHSKSGRGHGNSDGGHGR
ncbi:MAG TPA: hypothetical protein VGM60_07600 [Pseudonocardia sp.]|uniref:hypothetical protein n=1 Tax=Pseudonocardia sp. TaxID=60912 RepID=UPI002F42068A